MNTLVDTFPIYFEPSSQFPLLLKVSNMNTLVDTFPTYFVSNSNCVVNCCSSKVQMARVGVRTKGSSRMLIISKEKLMNLFIKIQIGQNLHNAMI